MKYTTILLLATLSTATNAADSLHDGMLSINTCEDATISNTKAKYWRDNLTPTEPPTKDSEYFTWINQSPWCYVQSKGAGHNSIRQYSTSGSTHEIQIHKSGQQQWIKNNWNDFKTRCVMPFDIYGGAIITRAYRTPTTAKACLIFSRNGLMHSQGDGASNQK